MRTLPRNPFRPGRGVAPPFLAGREEELALAERRLGELAEGMSPPQDLLLYGPRGNGKTALLARIADRASELGMRAERLPVAELDRKASLVRALQERIAPPVRVTGVQVAMVGVTAERSAPVAGVDSLLASWIERDNTPLVVLVDEVHAVSREAGRAFFDAVQTAKTDGLPFLLVAAGTPDAPRRIREMGTHNERAFEQMRIGRLERSATLAALIEPATMSGVRMDDAAAGALAEAAQDYPYFIQLLGSAAWDAADGVGAGYIHEQVARDGMVEARPRIESFYGERYREAQRRGVDGVLVSLASGFVESGGVLGDRKLEPPLQQIAERDDFPGHWTALREELEDLGLIWETSTGCWEMGIPSFAQHVLRRQADGS
ncbi:MAG: ATP-binding protein [Acidobacteria bacterium]|nr:ATP-binding protein [Acidobacteriota bacterium]